MVAAAPAIGSDACHLTELLGSWRLIYVNGPTRAGTIQIEPLWIWDRLLASHAAEHWGDLLLIEVHCRELLGSVPSPGDCHNTALPPGICRSARVAARLKAVVRTNAIDTSG